MLDPVPTLAESYLGAINPKKVQVQKQSKNAMFYVTVRIRMLKYQMLVIYNIISDF